jgi:hypothetical protein
MSARFSQARWLMIRTTRKPRCVVSIRVDESMRERINVLANYQQGYARRNAFSRIARLALQLGLDALERNEPKRKKGRG